MAASLLGAPTGVYAQTQLSDWRAANDAVGRFLRGHIDIVRAENKSGATNSGVQSDRPANALTLEQAKKRALQVRATDVFQPTGLSARERQRQAMAVTDLLLEVELAWLAAVGSNQALRLQQNATEAANIASELASRMGTIGNWGADRVLAVQLDAKAQQLRLLDAQNAARQSLLALESTLMTSGIGVADELPAIRGLGARVDLRASVDELAAERLNRLPDYRASLLAMQRWQELAGEGAIDQWNQYVNDRIDAVIERGDMTQLVIDSSKVLWNHNIKEALHARASIAELEASTRNTIALAQAAVRNSHEQAMLLANELVPLAMQAEEEAVYQYNGMFISTWNLLAQYRARVQVQMAAVNAQTLFLQTDAAFRAYMAGADYRPPSGLPGIELGASGGGGH
ncbi:MAG: hypothetical protein LRY53_07435 [Burkholderiaceae bacterium]|nr:hypothetical protein [Burkholderiaceae bacterium]MCD8565460.1 hypothetical protein [Burkholderiaceae bacterium]